VVEFIAEELFTNLVKYNRDGTEDIAIGLSWQPPEVVLTLRDFGVEGWDLTRVAPVDTEAPLERRRPGGLGLHLVRQIADRIDYAYENRNSTITVTKRLEN
jgi:anti-sigma regulatory factor (Ser/Thr protein kinase)